MKKIALEEHWGTIELMKLRSDWLQRENMPMNLPNEELKRIINIICDTEFRLDEMERNEIYYAALFPGSNGIEGITCKDEALTASRRFNNAMAKTVKAHPDKFTAFAAVPLQDPKAAADELERCMKEFGFVGSWISGYVYNTGFLDEEQFYPFFERAEKLGAQLYIHPTETVPDFSAIFKGCESLIGPPWSWGVDTATYVLRLIMNGVLDKFPGTSVIMGHMGEMLPYITWRLENRLTVENMESKFKKPVLDYFRENIMITTSGNLSPASLRCAIDVISADRIMFSIDYPFEPMQPASVFIDTVDITEKERRMICYKNAERLLHLK